MKGTLKPKVKICCISSIQEAQLAIQLGADAIGLVSQMPSGPGIISDKLIKEITQSIPSNIESFLLTSKTSVDEIIEQHKFFKTSTIQIVDKIISGNYNNFKEKISEVKIVQVVHVLNEDAIKEAYELSQNVDAILLDSGNPNLKTKELGGTGRIHNWEISKAIRKKLDIPVFLAGGLNSTNVSDAIKFVQPYGIDLCSGVRTDKNLDIEKLKAFFDATNVQ